MGNWNIKTDVCIVPSMVIPSAVKLIRKMDIKEITTEVQALEFVTKNRKGYKLLSNNLRNIKNIAIEAVKLDGFNLQYVSEELRADKEIVSSALIRKLRIIIQTIINQLKFLIFLMSPNICRIH